MRRIARHRHVPKAIHAAAAEHRIIRAAQKQKYAASSGEYFLNNITAAHILWDHMLPVNVSDRVRQWKLLLLQAFIKRHISGA